MVVRAAVGGGERADQIRFVVQKLTDGGLDERMAGM